MTTTPGGNILDRHRRGSKVNLYVGIFIFKKISEFDTLNLE